MKNWQNEINGINMTDIVELLRDGIGEADLHDAVDLLSDRCWDAALEIERLRKALEQCRDELDEYYRAEYDYPIYQKRLKYILASNPARLALEGK